MLKDDLGMKTVVGIFRGATFVLILMAMFLLLARCFSPHWCPDGYAAPASQVHAGRKGGIFLNRARKGKILVDIDCKIMLHFFLIPHYLMFYSYFFPNPNHTSLLHPIPSHPFNSGTCFSVFLPSSV